MSSKPTKQTQPASRPPVDALQYEKLAFQAFDFCNRHVSQLETLVTFAATICRSPAITIEERRNHRTLLELLVHTAEQYQQQLAGDRELFQVIALDAKGVAQSRITADRAARLLEESAQIANGTPAPAEPGERDEATETFATDVSADAQQLTATKH
ncbi:hypothetical protein B0G76_3146 [Paraburkholderia sp. BL23I1N1]|nr:hypothetical protein [Paraburkholderia sp. BL23I1N1]RKE36927.1 hypothetical protein B0G76_3146 [Paraburkholderia sp. BL23I1N1]